MDPAHKLQIITLANETLALMDGTTGPIQRIIDSSDVVWGVWQDGNDVDMHLIKGQRRLAALATGADSAPAGTTRMRRGAVNMRVGAIPCDSPEAAVALQMTLGEPDLV